LLAALFTFCNNLIASSIRKPAIEWVEIPAGTFILGSPAGEEDSKSKEIQHSDTDISPIIVI